MKRKVTTAVLLDKRRKRKTGLYAVSLRITYMRVQKYYVMGYHYTPEEFEKVIGPKPRNKYKEAKMKLLKMEEKAIRVIESLPEFSFYAFEEAYFKKSTSSNLVFDAFEKTIIRLKGEGRVGTADSYKCSYNSLKKFTNRKSLTFEEVTPDFLKSYEGWMIQYGKTGTTVGIYLRCMKALFNEAIQLGAVQPDLYPFGKRKYQIPAGRNIKKALSLAEIEKFVRYESVPYSSEDWAKDLWIFSYLCNGINIKDIAKLKYQNIDGDQVVFVRAKTKLTTRQQQKPVVAYLTPEAKNIIEKWGNKPAMPTQYVFPILEENMDPERELAITRQTIKNVNKYLKRIAAAAGIEKPITTYTARHSFSTVLKRSGASIEFISESLGHQDKKTTENYLDSFEQDTRKEYAAKLMDFGDRES